MNHNDMILDLRKAGTDIRIYEYDLLGFFPNINKSLLTETYTNQLMVPKKYLRRMEAFDSIPLIIDKELRRSDTGLPQGSATSPILANLVLNQLQLLDTLSRGSTIIQYADDGMIIGKVGEVEYDVLEYQSRLRDGVSISTEKSGWNSTGIVKFIGFTLDLNTGIFMATPRSGEDKFIANIYEDKVYEDQLDLKLRHAFVLDSQAASQTIRREPRFRGYTCESLLSKLISKG
jgi:hypothetical protein